MALRVLLTGGAGFMGSTVAREMTRRGWEVVVYDALTYAGDRANLDGVDAAVVHGDVCDGALLWPEVHRADVVVHMAAESHVERSFTRPELFVRTNVQGTRSVLEACAAEGRPLVHVSTDEVFGSAPEGVAFGEDAPLRPGNPYAATKAAAECLLYAWRHTHGLRPRLVRCTNNYGLRQHPEKLVAGWIGRALRGEPLPLHGRGEAVRDWLHVEDFARGLCAVVEYEGPREVFHFAGRQPRSNRQMGELLGRLCGGARLEEVPDRRGQDARYALDDGPTRADLGWEPRVALEEGLAELVARTRVALDEGAALTS